jgi:hypothetical protein
MRLKSESEILAELFMNPSNGKANCKYKRMRTVVIGVG